MLGGHEDKPLLLCSNTIGPFWRNRSESGFWGTSIRSPSHKYKNPGDHLSATQVLSIRRVLSKFCGLTLIFDTCTVPFLMIPFRICISRTGHSPQHNSSGLKKKKSQVIHLCMCVINGVTSSDIEEDFYIQLFLQVGVSVELENQLWLLS